MGRQLLHVIKLPLVVKTDSFSSKVDIWNFLYWHLETSAQYHLIVIGKMHYFFLIVLNVVSGYECVFLRRLNL